MGLLIPLILLSAAPGLALGEAASPWEVSLDASERVRQQAFWRGGASFVLPGAGQFMNHDATKGWSHLAAGLALAAVPVVVATWPYDFGTKGDQEARLAGAIVWPFYLTTVGFHLYSALDAYQVKTGIRPAGGVF